MNGRVASLYKSLDVPDLLLDSLNSGKNISIVANPGLHRTFTYLKSIIKSIQPEPESENQNNFHINRIQSSLPVQKYVLFTSDRHTSIFLYSFCRHVSQDHIFHRINSKFMAVAHSVLFQDSESSPKFQFPKSDILFATQSISLKNLNPTYLIFDGISQNNRNEIIKQFPNSKNLSISSFSVKSEVEIKFNFAAPHKTIKLQKQNKDQLMQILMSRSLTIIVFPNERKQKEFANQYRKILCLYFYTSSNIWYPAGLASNKAVALSTVQDMEKIIFPFERWIFFDMDLKTYQRFARSGADNIFLSN